jgi:hypothetical protein
MELAGLEPATSWSCTRRSHGAQLARTPQFAAVSPRLSVTRTGAQSRSSVNASLRPNQSSISAIATNSRRPRRTHRNSDAMRWSKNHDCIRSPWIRMHAAAARHHYWLIRAENGADGACSGGRRVEGTTRHRTVTGPALSRQRRPRARPVGTALVAALVAGDVTPQEHDVGGHERQRDVESAYPQCPDHR